MVRGWITYDNRMVTMEEMSHQHMSNIYYYTKYIVPQLYPQCVREDIQKWLLIRFDGVILPYRPVHKFVMEQEYLAKMGYLKENNDIVVNGELIGKY